MTIPVILPVALFIMHECSVPSTWHEIEMAHSHDFNSCHLVFSIGKLIAAFAAYCAHATHGAHAIRVHHVPHAALSLFKLFQYAP